jgi:transcriptional regulator with XRE-family HTH domain
MTDSTSNPVRYLGQQVRRARNAAGWSLAEFGQRIGYAPGAISRIENGKRPPTELFAQMCDLWVPKTLSPYATWEYSWIRPPSRSRRRTRTSAPDAGGRGRPAGGLCCSARCGRCEL